MTGQAKDPPWRTGGPGGVAGADSMRPEHHFDPTRTSYMPDDDFDLTTPAGVSGLMATSRSEAEWNANCDRVKAANARNGRPDYPPFWHATVIASGLMSRMDYTWALTR